MPLASGNRYGSQTPTRAASTSLSARCLLDHLDPVRAPWGHDLRLASRGRDPPAASRQNRVRAVATSWQHPYRPMCPMCPENLTIWTIWTLLDPSTPRAE